MARGCFTAASTADPAVVCERLFPGSRDLLDRYPIDIRRCPEVVEPVGAETIGYRPSRHFGTFLNELATLDQETPDRVAAMRCPY